MFPEHPNPSQHVYPSYSSLCWTRSHRIKDHLGTSLLVHITEYNLFLLGVLMPNVIRCRLNSVFTLAWGIHHRESSLSISRLQAWRALGSDLLGDSIHYPRPPPLPIMNYRRYLGKWESPQVIDYIIPNHLYGDPGGTNSQPKENWSFHCQFCNRSGANSTLSSLKSFLIIQAALHINVKYFGAY